MDLYGTYFPPEVVTTIFDHLNRADIGRCRLVQEFEKDEWKER